MWVLTPLPTAVFLVVLILGRDELGWRGIAISVGIWLGLLLGSICSVIPPLACIAAVALMDVALILIVFRRDFPFWY